MGEQTPSMGGLHQPPEKIESLLSLVRENLDMDVAFVSEFAGDKLLFRALEGDAESFGWREGEGFPLDESYCKRVLDGRLPNVVPDARSEDSTKDLRCLYVGRRSALQSPKAPHPILHRQALLQEEV
jgi:hypothetical protein